MSSYSDRKYRNYKESGIYSLQHYKALRIGTDFSEDLSYKDVIQHQAES